MAYGPKTIEEARANRYGAWAGNPKGHSFEEGRCAAEVAGGGFGMILFQCARKAKYGIYCGIHKEKEEHP